MMKSSQNSIKILACVAIALDATFILGAIIPAAYRLTLAQKIRMCLYGKYFQI